MIICPCWNVKQKPHNTEHCFLVHQPSGKSRPFVLIGKSCVQPFLPSVDWVSCARLWQKLYYHCDLNLLCSCWMFKIDLPNLISFFPFWIQLPAKRVFPEECRLFFIICFVCTLQWSWLFVCVDDLLVVAGKAANVFCITPKTCVFTRVFVSNHCRVSFHFSSFTCLADRRQTLSILLSDTHLCGALEKRERERSKNFFKLSFFFKKNSTSCLRHRRLIFPTADLKWSHCPHRLLC